MKHFVTMQSKDAPCIPLQNISAQFRKTVKHNNRANKQRIGKLKRTGEQKLCINMKQTSPIELRLRALLCNANRETYINDVFQHLCGDIVPGLELRAPEPSIFNGARAAASICLLLWSRSWSHEKNN